jgi:hypothetical protein
MTYSIQGSEKDGHLNTDQYSKLRSVMRLKLTHSANIKSAVLNLLLSSTSLEGILVIGFASCFSKSTAAGGSCGEFNDDLLLSFPFSMIVSRCGTFSCPIDDDVTCSVLRPWAPCLSEVMTKSEYNVGKNE